MKKIIILVVVLILISIGLVSCFYINNRNKENKLLNQKETSNEVIKDLNEEEEDIENESISEDIKNDNDDNKNISNNDVNTSKSNMESNSSGNSNVVNNKKQENKNVTQVKEEKHEPENKPVVQEPTPEPPKKEQTPWESLGISEYDYYNKSMWSWARIDYSVKVYGTLEQTHQACIDAGNKLEDIISFSCDNINSYSGDYLGDMLRVKK